MLSLHPLDDKDAESATRSFYGAQISGQTVALNVDGVDAGILTFTISPDLVAHIKAVAVLPEYRGKGFGDFLTRSMMNSFTLANMGVCVDYDDVGDYYSKFGFRPTDKGLYVSASDIVFPSKCGHH